MNAVLCSHAGHQRAHERENRQFQLLIDNVNDAYIGTDKRGVIIDWNARAAQSPAGWA